ncbi:MAG TPA: carboxypeptidase-like regulatory domain-containing protein [Roseateles sp.]
MLKAFAMAWFAGTACALVQAASLSLPCTGADGRPVAGTVVKALREGGEGQPAAAPAQDGICRIELPAGAHWVKAEAPGMRSVAIRAVDGAAAGRELRLLPLTGRDAGEQRRLQQMVQRDQAARQALQAAQQQGDAPRIEKTERDMQEVGRANQAQLAQWLQARDFPRAADVGFDGVGAFWLLLQHAPDLMAPCLPQLRAAAAAGELQRSNLALSEDRLAMVQGRPQRYGSQLQPGKDGKLEVYPLLDPAKVDAWRAERDLEPLADYLKHFGL